MNKGSLYDDSHRVVVTGIGAVTSIGHGKDSFWKNLIEGKSGISRIESFNPEGMATKYGGEVKDFNPSIYLSAENASRFGRASQLGASAAKLAFVDALLGVSDLREKNISIITGTTMGESQVLEGIDRKWVSGGEGLVGREEVLQYPGNIIAINIAKELDVDANCVVIPTACAAGNYAIGYGYDQIQSGRADIAIVGGCDAFSRIALTGFSRLYAVAPEKCQPFDQHRKGILVGEGAGILILESLTQARSRSATIYAEVAGYALTCDASHMTIPDVESVSKLMSKALENTRLNPNQIDYISAHGTGTRQNDKTECAAINRVFGPHTNKPPTSSIKSMLGHTMGAASALEAIACTMAIYNSKIPPTINHEMNDLDCLIDCVPNVARSKKVDRAINNSFAFGGNNACLILQKTELDNVNQ